MRIKQILLSTLFIISPLLLLATDYYVATTGLNVRSGAGKEYTSVFTLQKGDKVAVLSKNGAWYKIEYSKQIGYANSRYLISEAVKSNSYVEYFQFILFIAGVIAIWLFKRWLFDIKRKQRRDYYRNEYLQSDAWQRKRYVVLKRDNWRCVYCGAPATQVHHKRYAKINIGREPIEWLVSICKSCHDSKHHKVNNN